MKFIQPVNLKYCTPLNLIEKTLFVSLYLFEVDLEMVHFRSGFQVRIFFYQLLLESVFKRENKKRFIIECLIKS